MLKTSPRPQKYFYPRPLRGGRPELLEQRRALCDISIHALREEGDPGECHKELQEQVFLSTPSARRATFYSDACGSHAEFLSTPSARRATERR